jgi:molecular chaperone GrpE (heat shock protein)
MNEQEFEEAFSDEEFVDKLLCAETGEEMKEILDGKGINLSPDELDKFAEVLVCALQKGKKLGDRDMAKISGGVIIEEVLTDKGLTLTGSERAKFDKILTRILKKQDSQDKRDNDFLGEF